MPSEPTDTAGSAGQDRISGSAATAVCGQCDGRGWNLRDCRIQVCECGIYDDPPKWVKRGDAPCLIPHFREPNRPRRASVGYACAGHRDRLERMLAELPALHDDLEAALTSSEKSDGDHRKGHSTSTGLSLNEKTLDLREEVHSELVRLVRWVYEERGDVDLPGRWVVGSMPIGVHGPANIEWQAAPDTIAALATWLIQQVDWICSQLDIDDEYANLSRLTRDCRLRAAPSGRHRLEIGPCGEGDCPGRLWLTSDPNQVDEARTMACDDCRRMVEPRYWRRERRRIDGVDVNPWLTLSEAAVQYGTTTRTVERWVKKGRLKARGTPMRVKASAVEALMRTFTGKCA